jgi:hypothetical protein
VLVASADNGNDDAGSYIVRRAKAIDAFVVPSGDDGGAMVPSIEYQATIDRAESIGRISADQKRSCFGDGSGRGRASR